MKLVIDIPWDDFYIIQQVVEMGIGSGIDKIICSGTPLSKKHDWIPVRERLPDDGQNVLFCDIDGYIMIGYHVNDRPKTHFSQDGTYEDIKNVRAWMPLPDPYEKDKGGHK